MPHYKPLKGVTPKSLRRRTLRGIKRLREQCDAEMPAKTRSRTLILGTWNLRNFDDNRFGNGYRSIEDLYYIAEIISRFDVLAVQEICHDLGAIERLMALLGPDYHYVVTDVTEGRSGNGERLGFIYDRAAVSFKGIAGELVLPDNMQIISDGRKRQFSRSPFMCSFQAGWFKFLFSTVHIYFGSDRGPQYARRVEEIGAVSKFLAKRAKADDRNHVLVGDFNIKQSGSPGFNALQKNGFEVVQNQKGSNADQTRFYDQISFLSRPDELRPCEGDKSRGVLQFFDSIFRDKDFRSYRRDLLAIINGKIIDETASLAALNAAPPDQAKPLKIRRWKTRVEQHQKAIDNWQSIAADDDELKTYYLRIWRTFHASDHLPLWVELEIDFSDAYLEHLYQ